MGGTHRHREGAHPPSPILIFKSALRFPKEASMGGTHSHREGAHPSSPIAIFKVVTPPPRRCPSQHPPPHPIHPRQHHT